MAHLSVRASHRAYLLAAQWHDNARHIRIANRNLCAVGVIILDAAPPFNAQRESARTHHIGVYQSSGLLIYQLPDFGHQSSN